MAELSARSGLPVPTIKYYLREGLLQPGTAVGATRARYDESHLRRLRLVRALVEVAQLRLDVVRSVLDGIDNAKTRHDAVGAAHLRLSQAAADDPAPSDDALRMVDEMLERNDWTLMPQSPHRVALARALDTVESLGLPVGEPLLDAYAHAMREAAAVELGFVAGTKDRELAVEHAVIGTLLLEPVLLAMRRIAQVNVSRDQLPD